MFCHKCGKELKIGDNFCTECGAVILVEKEKPFKSNVIKTSGGIKKLLKFCLWLGLIIFGIWLIIALGPLWIIAIILGLILFVLASK